MNTDKAPGLILEVRFYKSAGENEPVREWLQSLPRAHKKAIGEDIKTVQFGWPLGMPVVRKLEAGLWEVRTRLKDSIARVVFTVEGETMVLLHGFIKKSQKTPRNDIETARSRKKEIRG